jgi:hypothetical protein
MLSLPPDDVHRHPEALRRIEGGSGRGVDRLERAFAPERIGPEMDQLVSHAAPAPFGPRDQGSAHAVGLAHQDRPNSRRWQARAPALGVAVAAAMDETVELKENAAAGA